MININKEAEEYAKKECSDLYNISLYHNKMHTYGSVSIKDFIAGHNSKATQVKILQAQIDVLKSIDCNMVGYMTTQIYLKIENLQQQLKQLEDE